MNDLNPFFNKTSFTILHKITYFYYTCNSFKIENKIIFTALLM